MLETLQEANVWFDLALEIEPNFADANIWAADYFTHFLMENYDNADISDEQRSSAMERIVRYHENAARHASREISRIVADYDLAVVTGEWRKLPALYDDLNAESGCLSASWSMETSIPYGKAEQALASALAEIECNPIGFSAWVEAIQANIYLGNLDTAIEMGLRKLDATPHIRIYQQLFFAYLAAGRFAEAEALIDRHVHRDNQSLPLRVFLSAARGDAERARADLTVYLRLGSEIIRSPLNAFAVTGDRDSANQEAARIDALPNGHLILMLIPLTCRCGAPFDLEAAPNFAGLIEDADFPWPPPSPIEWPLKDW